MTSIEDVAGEYARMAVANIATEFPHATQHVVREPGEPSRPRELHPAFHGSYDWHSCVEMHWVLVLLLDETPAHVDQGLVRETLDRTLRVDTLAAETSYLRANPSFERPYGWAWALTLAAACARCADTAARRWSAALTPLADAVEDLTLEWLELAVAPVRHGVHRNTAFGLAMMHGSAVALGRDHLAAAIAAWARERFGGDRDYPARWEPSGEDFLSPALCEVDLMRRVLPAEEFPGWLAGFLPDPVGPFTPVEVRNAQDGHQAHLFGLNLSRAAHLRAIAGALGDDDPRVPALRRAADRHLAAGLPHVTGEGFLAEHWLSAYACLALTAERA
jgi:hypothetical protein